MNIFLRFFVSLFILFSFSVSGVYAATTSSLLPIADGGDDSASWFNTTNSACSGVNCYTEVDETTGSFCTNSDGDTSYIYSSGSNISQTFDVNESSIPDGSTVSQVSVTACYYKQGSNGGTFQTRYCLNGSCSNSGVNVSTGNSYASVTQNFSVNFVKNSSTDLEIGILDNDAGKDVRISQIKTIVTYTPPADTTAPSAVSNLSASNPTTSSIDLSWTAPGDDGNTGTATSYDIRYSTSNITNDTDFNNATQVTGEPTPSVAGSSESMTVSGLSANTTYYFAIKTSDEVPNTSALSNITNSTTLAPADTTAPSAVSDLSASNPTTSTIDLSWTAPGDDNNTGTATSYDVRYSTSNITNDTDFNNATQVSGEPTPSAAGSSESMTVSGLTQNTTYYFAIKTSDEIPNTSALSNIANSTTLSSSDSTAPSAVSNLSASNPTTSTIDLSWTAPGDDNNTGTATSYDVRYSTSNIINDSDFNNATQAVGEPTPSVAGSSESMTVSGLSQNTTYYFAIKTSDEVPNISALSNVTNSTTLLSSDSTAPSAVSNLSASNPTTSSIDLSWTAPGDDGNTGTATSYDIRYSTSNITNDTDFNNATQVTGEPTPSVAGSSESMTVSGLSANTTYYFAIKTSDEVPNTSALSNVTMSKTKESSSVIIPPATSGGVSPTRIQFSGRAFPGSRVELFLRSNIEQTLKNVPVENYSMSSDGVFSISNVALLTGKYFVVLKAVDKAGQETGSMSFSVDFSSEKELVANNILFPPTINFNKSVLGSTDNLIVSGYSSSNSSVELFVDDKSSGVKKTDTSGFYSFTFKQGTFGSGLHYVKIKQTTADGVASEFSFPRTFRISSLEFPKADFNNDGVINITDWSVFLYRWASKDTSVRNLLDLDGNGKIDIVDFSIFLKVIKI